MLKAELLSHLARKCTVVSREVSRGVLRDAGGVTSDDTKELLLAAPGAGPLLSFSRISSTRVTLGPKGEEATVSVPKPTFHPLCSGEGSQRDRI